MKVAVGEGSPKWVPLQIQILGKRRMIQLLFVPPGGKLQKRGRPIRVSALSNLNRDNELIVGFDEKTWNIARGSIKYWYSLKTESSVEPLV